MFKPDKKITISDLNRLVKHGIDVSIDEPEEGCASTSATLISGMSIVLVRADAEGVIDRIHPVVTNNEEVSDILSAMSYTYATVLERIG
jgi:hypothetical protein